MKPWHKVLAELAIAAGKIGVAAYADEIGIGVAVGVNGVLGRIGRRIAQPEPWYARAAPPPPALAVPAPEVCVSLWALGLGWPCTRDDARKAYRRLARAAHPDGKGDDEKFIALRRHYETALAAIEAREAKRGR
jgi:hypothetical protein